ncbi:hypothetical protein BJY01DRAFT_183290 [Aspergillus pseudoustus]|uniref:Uncharacterized protein n=1 Tax=Aspergillus pseudoustus TaxID=1810923 RepID=A0ABR4JZT4_9EURO
MTVDCAPAQQWALANNGSVEFDVDIVGVGVIVSFISTSLAALLALIIAFIAYAIPRDLLNDVDGMMVVALRTAIARIPPRSRGPSTTDTNDADDDEASADRLHAFRSFMMSITDQVLASHLAILIATFARHVDITLYSVDVVIALGCLACTVHLAMMPLLIDHFRKHLILKVSRSSLMVAGALMLVTLLIMQLSDTWRDHTHIYFQCAVRDLQLDILYDPVGFLAQLFVPLVILFGYCQIISLLYSRGEESPSDPNMLDRIDKWWKELQLRIETARRQWLRYAPRKAITQKRNLRMQRLQAMRYAEIWAFYECQGSFLWRIIWLVSANFYGVTSVLLARSDTTGISGDRDKMGYGQIVPLVLLVLPALAAIQGVYDYHDSVVRRKEKRHSPPDSAAVSSTSLAGVTEVGTPDETDALSAATTPRPESEPAASGTIGEEPPNSPPPSMTTHEAVVAAVFLSPTIPAHEPLAQNSQEGVDRSLWKWAHSEDGFASRPFAHYFVYAHTTFMLVLAILLSWGLAAGPAELIWALGGILGLIGARRFASACYFLWFVSRHRDDIGEWESAVNDPGKQRTQTDYNQVIMRGYTAGDADDAAADDGGDADTAD